MRPVGSEVLITVNRRKLLKSGALFALAGLPTALNTKAQQEEEGQSDVPPGGVPSVDESGVVQFDYPDGTKVRVYDNKIEVFKPKQQKPDVRPRQFPIDVQSLTPPPLPKLPNDATLNDWLIGIAEDLRLAIKTLLAKSGNSDSEYAKWESRQSLTIYNRIAVRYKYVKRIARAE